MTDFVQVITTAPNRETAQTIADALLNEHLAACVQIVGPIESHYWWQGKLERAEEWQCLAKSSLRHYRRLEEAIRRVHPYEVPEILAARIETGHAAYLDWLQEQLTRS